MHDRSGRKHLSRRARFKMQVSGVKVKCAPYFVLRSTDERNIYSHKHLQFIPEKSNGRQGMYSRMDRAPKPRRAPQWTSPSILYFSVTNHRYLDLWVRYQYGCWLENLKCMRDRMRTWRDAFGSERAGMENVTSCCRCNDFVRNT